ncbi:MAG: hydrolase [Streptosporangiales bacterium]|nr:hydrolase [Streptosporangiales bacterium]
MFVDENVQIDLGAAVLEADLAIPSEAIGVVVFVHGSGSDRQSPRNRQVAETLLRDSLGTALVDLLTAEEDELDRVTRQVRFDIPLLAERTTAIVDWLTAEPRTADEPVGLFGASTGAAAALIAAANRPDAVRAVVSRGGRVDLAEAALPQVVAPTLLVVGEHDAPVLEINQRLQPQIATSRLDVVPGATHLFEEPGALDQVAEAAGAWFARHLPGHR